jgi:hypothetical protein
MDVTVKLRRQTNKAVEVRPREEFRPWNCLESKFREASESDAASSSSLRAKKGSEPCQNTPKIEGLTAKAVLLGECYYNLNISKYFGCTR